MADRDKGWITITFDQIKHIVPSHLPAFVRRMVKGVIRVPRHTLLHHHRRCPFIIQLLLLFLIIIIVPTHLIITVIMANVCPQHQAVTFKQ